MIVRREGGIKTTTASNASRFTPYVFLVLHDLRFRILLFQ